MAKKILVLFAHPALEKSRVNHVLVNAVRDLDGVTVNDLYEEYPDFFIDVAREQALLLDHDVLIFQHPLFWYSTPSILKEWQDLVLQHGWAYGRDGTALRGKQMFNAITTGGSQRSYDQGDSNPKAIRRLLAPLEQTFELCGVEYLPPFAVHGTLAMKADVAQAHAADYRRFVQALRDGRVDTGALRGLERANDGLDGAIKDGVDG